MLNHIFDIDFEISEIHVIRLNIFILNKAKILLQPALRVSTLDNS